jgi:hypothetical protein
LPVDNIKSDALDFGEVTLDADQATSSTDIADNAGSFDIELGMLKEIASTDNMTQGLKNTYANTSADGKTYYAIKPFFIYRGSSDAAENKFSTPEGIKFTSESGSATDPGYGFYFNMHDPANATFDQVCSPAADPKHKTLSFIPPSDLKKNSAIYNATNPLTNGDPTPKSEGDGTISCSSGEFYARGTAGAEQVGFNFGGGGYSGAILPGLWKMEIEDKQVAAFDLSAYSPVDKKGLPLNYVPSLKLTTKDRKITKMEIKFYYYDKSAAQFREVEDLGIFRRSATKLGVNIDGFSPTTGSCTGDSFSITKNLETVDGNTYSLTDFNGGDVYMPGQSLGSERVTNGLAIHYDLAGVVIHFEFRPTVDKCK